MTATKKQSVFSNLFVKFIEQPKEKEVEEVIPEGMVKTTTGSIIPLEDAAMVIRKGKLVGWTNF